MYTLSYSSPYYYIYYKETKYVYKTRDEKEAKGLIELLNKEDEEDENAL